MTSRQFFFPLGDLEYLLIAMGVHNVLGPNPIHDFHEPDSALVVVNESVAQGLFEHEQGVVVNEGEDVVAEHPVSENRP